MRTLNIETPKARRTEREAQANPLDLLKKAVEANPNATTDSVYEAFKEDLLEIQNDAHLDVVIMSWFGPAFAALTVPEKDVHVRAHERSKRREELEAEKEAVKAKILSKVILLDMVLPHGKTLRESTGCECAELGPKIGGWLSRIGSEVKLRQTVGAVLSEQRVRALYLAA